MFQNFKLIKTIQKQ